MIQCTQCGAQNADYARLCSFCGTTLVRPELAPATAHLRDQLLGMSLGIEDFNTICFALDVDWRLFAEMKDEAGKVEMLARQVEAEGRIREVDRFLRDFRFPQGYPPLPEPPADNLWLTYVFACQNIKTMDALQGLADEIGVRDAAQLPGAAVPHKIREALWAARRAGSLSRVVDWLGKIRPAPAPARPRERRW